METLLGVTQKHILPQMAIYLEFLTINYGLLIQIQENLLPRTGIIPLEKGMKIQKVEITESNNKDDKKNQNYNNDSHRMVGEERSGLITGTIGASVGNKATSVMLQDKIYMMGGTQLDYVASNHLNRIDISDTFNPKIKKT